MLILKVIPGTLLAFSHIHYLLEYLPVLLRYMALWFGNIFNLLSTHSVENFKLQQRNRHLMDK